MDVRATTDAPVDTGEARSELRSLAVAHAAGKRWILAGGGSRDAFDSERARVLAAAVLARAQELGTRSLCWELPHKVDDEVAGALVEGTVLAAYRYAAFKSEPGRDRAPAELLVSAHHDVSRAVELGRVGAEAANRARDLGNAPPNAMTPAALAEYARGLPGVSVEVWGRAEIEAAEMGAFAAVAQGSDNEPRLITARYDGGPGPLGGVLGKGGTVDAR